MQQLDEPSCMANRVMRDSSVVLTECPKALRRTSTTLPPVNRVGDQRCSLLKAEPGESETLPTGWDGRGTARREAARHVDLAQTAADCQGVPPLQERLRPIGGNGDWSDRAIVRNRRPRDVRGDRGRGEHLAPTRPDSGVEGTSILNPPSVQNHERRSCQTTTRIARTLTETTNPMFHSSTNVFMTCGPGWRGPGGARRRVSGPRGFKARAVTARGRQVHATVSPDPADFLG